MELFLRVGDIYMEIANLTLKKGFVPCVGDQTMKEQVEPALWFKVAVLDSLSIDCNKRTVMWNCDSALAPLKDTLKYSGNSPVSHDRCKRISESMYIGGECSGVESDMDELFTSLQQLISQYECLPSNSRISTEAFNESLLRLLHCYVLPAIKLGVEDLPQVTIGSQHLF